MRYDIIFSPSALDDIRSFKANARAIVGDPIETFLRSTPTASSKSRIKRLRGISSPQYRLRVDDWRIYYDVEGGTVLIHAVLAKAESIDWLNRIGGAK